MRLSCSFLVVTAMLGNMANTNVDAQMVKMCLFYDNPSGHARSDPIVNQKCPSGHVHSFYGPKNFHPTTSYEEIRDTPAKFGSSPYVENQSLYWHPTIYQVSKNSGSTVYKRTAGTSANLYYRWDKSSQPATEAFPPGFRMIAHSSDPRAGMGQAEGKYNLLSECCGVDAEGNEDGCETWPGLVFPEKACSHFSIFFSMPTCWDGKSLGDDNDHKSHMAYTMDGTVNGACPSGFDKRFPQIQFNLNVGEYDGANNRYELSDKQNTVWHIDFFNGWKEKKLQEIIDQCPPQPEDDPTYYHPECGCTPDFQESTTFLTPNEEMSQPVCDSDVRRLVMDEATNVTNELPFGECQGPALIPKSWNQMADCLFQCTSSGGDDEDGDGDEDLGTRRTQTSDCNLWAHTSPPTSATGKAPGSAAFQVDSSILSFTSLFAFGFYLAEFILV